MNVFWFDRIQYSQKDGKLIIFEFFECELESIQLINDSSWNLDLANKIFDQFTLQKHRIIRNLMKSNNSLVYYVVIYSKNDHEKKVVIQYKDKLQREILEFNDFTAIQEWFLEVNNVDGSGKSKPLGDLKTETTYAKSIIKNIWGSAINESDDQGLEFVMAMLSVTNPDGSLNRIYTQGFDFDLFVYFENSNEFLIIEFALNSGAYYKDNCRCSPMRYCWGNGNPKVPDNKMKFNMLWKATKILGGILTILNYSEPDDHLGFSIIKDLDENKGIRSEVQYRLSKKDFESAIQELTKLDKLSFDNFERVGNPKDYNVDFFDSWEKNKTEYGVRDNNG